MSIKTIKIIGIIATIIGAGTNLVTSWVDDKKMDDKITNKLLEALSKNKGS